MARAPSGPRQQGMGDLGAKRAKEQSNRSRTFELPPPAQKPCLTRNISFANMKPLDVIQLVLGILVGTCVLRPDIAGLPSSTTSKETSWPREVEVAMRRIPKNENKVALCRARRGGTTTASLPKTIAPMPLRAGALVGGKIPFSESERRKSSQHPSRNLATHQKEHKAKVAKEIDANAVMIATHHGCEVF